MDQFTQYAHRPARRGLLHAGACTAPGGRSLSIVAGGRVIEDIVG